MGVAVAARISTCEWSDRHFPDSWWTQIFQEVVVGGINLSAWVWYCRIRHPCCSMMGNKHTIWFQGHAYCCSARKLSFTTYLPRWSMDSWVIGSSIFSLDPIRYCGRRVNNVLLLVYTLWNGDPWGDWTILGLVTYSNAMRSSRLIMM